MRDDLEYVMAGTEAEMLQGGFQRRGAGAPEARTDNIHHGVLPEFPSADQRGTTNLGAGNRTCRAQLPVAGPMSS